MNNVMPKIVLSEHTVLIANIDIKLKRFSSKTAPKTDWSQLGNTDCRSRIVENFQKLRFEGQNVLSAVGYASNALPSTKRRSSYLWYDNPELDYARRQVRSCTDKYGVSCRRYADAITNLESLHATAAAWTATKIKDGIGLHSEQCKPAAAIRAINQLTGKKFKPFNCLSAASIVQRKWRPTTHYSANRNSQLNKKKNSNTAFVSFNNGYNEIAIRSPINLQPPKFHQHYGRRVVTHLAAKSIFRIKF